jgi:hypothetical protein
MSNHEKKDEVLHDHKHDGIEVGMLFVALTGHLGGFLSGVNG